MRRAFIEIDGILVEVDELVGEAEMISANSNDAITKVEGSMDRVKDILLKIVSPITETYNQLNKDITLEKAEVEVGVGFSAKGNIFIASGEGSANLNIKLIFTPKEK